MATLVLLHLLPIRSMPIGFKSLLQLQRSSIDRVELEVVTTLICRSHDADRSIRLPHLSSSSAAAAAEEVGGRSPGILPRLDQVQDEMGGRGYKLLHL